MRKPSPSSARSQQVNRQWHWRALVAVSLLVCFSWSASAQQQQPPSTPPSKDQGTPPAQDQFQNQAQTSSQGQREPESGEKIRQRAEWFYQQRAYPIGLIPAGARQRALEQLD